MRDFFVNVIEILGRLAWSDWLIMTALIGFMWLGIKRGLIQELIHSGFLILALVMAWLFYPWLADSAFIIWLTFSHPAQLTIAFGAIFVGVLVIKTVVYKLIAMASAIHDPCTLNQPFMLAVSSIAITLVSWYYLHSLTELEIMNIVIGIDFLDNTLTRIGLLFALVFVMIMGVYSSLSKALNFSIKSSQPCLLAAFFQKILNGFRHANRVLQANNNQPLLSALVGFVKGALILLILVFILQNITWISQQYDWAQSKGALKTFQEAATYVKPELSPYLLFIE